MTRTVTVKTIDELNKLAGQTPTLYTWVSVLDYPVFTLPEGYSCIKTDFYTVTFEKIEEEGPCHGCKCYDFRELALTFHVPGELIKVESGFLPVRIVAFHADLFFGTRSGIRRPEHTFFIIMKTRRSTSPCVRNILYGVCWIISAGNWTMVPTSIAGNCLPPTSVFFWIIVPAFTGGSSICAPI